MAALKKLREAVVAATAAINHADLDDEAAILARLCPVLSDLIATDEWFPETYTQPHPEHYQAFLLHGDPLGRLSLIGYAWGPGQKTPVHDHRMWGIVGVVRGALTATNYRRGPQGLIAEAPQRLAAGGLTMVSPRLGDIHAIANAVPDAVTLSVHLYGGDVSGTVRGIFDPDTGAERPFVSGYANATTPNLWDRLEEMRAGLNLRS